MSLSVYVHIPYCIQRCRYCDFTTFEQNTIMPPENYLNLLLHEMRSRYHSLSPQRLRSIYFGGGTPSLVPADHIVTIIEELAKLGFDIDQRTEITIEINPATINEDSLKVYLDAGINRFSVGAQTFNDDLLKICGREHNSQQTRQTLDLLAKFDLNYTFDLLFALPTQTIAHLQSDLNEISMYKPDHLSAYCLTIPQGHPMDRNRPSEDHQVDMFQIIESHLKTLGILKYEISNFARPGFESQHNLSYWTNRPYWGVGLSAHSYLPNINHGVRFWNPKSFSTYQKQVELIATETPFQSLPIEQVEHLELHEGLSDICHMFFRLKSGLPEHTLKVLFSENVLEKVWPRLQKLQRQELALCDEGHWKLTSKGELLSNQVFAELSFNSAEIR